MDKKRIISLTLALALSTGLLSGCSDKTKTEVSDNTESIVIADSEKYEDTLSVVNGSTNRIDHFEEAPEIKEFDPGEHVFMVRYHLLDELGYLNAESINSLSITVPEGYEILKLDNFVGLGGKIGTGQTYGVDVWFINNEKVAVKPVYNEIFRFYDYSQPGSVLIINENTENLELGK